MNPPLPLPSVVRWVLDDSTEEGEPLHRLAAIEWEDLEDERGTGWDGSSQGLGETVCGRSLWARLPGPAEGRYSERCQDCCDGIGIPGGIGVPAFGGGT